VAEKTVREIVIRVTFDPDTNQCETHMSAKDINPGILWEALKANVTHMAKVAPWVSDPEEREVLSQASGAMKLLCLGVEQAVGQVRARRRIQSQEQTGGTT